MTAENAPEPVPLKFTKEKESFAVATNWFSRVTYVDINESERRLRRRQMGNRRVKIGGRKEKRRREREEKVPREFQHIERFRHNRACRKSKSWRVRG